MSLFDVTLFATAFATLTVIMDPAATSASAMCGRPTGPPSGAKETTSSQVIG